MLRNILKFLLSFTPSFIRSPVSLFLSWDNKTKNTSCHVTETPEKKNKVFHAENSLVAENLLNIIKLWQLDAFHKC